MYSLSWIFQQLQMWTKHTPCMPMFLAQVNNNSFGLAPADQNVAVGTLAPGGSGSAQVPMAFNPAKLAQGPSNMKLQVRASSLCCCILCMCVLLLAC
jgi:hypothetical protein